MPTVSCDCLPACKLVSAVSGQGRSLTQAGESRSNPRRLYLVKLTGTLADGTEASLETVFPGFPERVFAHWYTGTLRIPRGQRLRYRHMGYDSVHERDEMLEFEQGVIRRTWVRHNGEAEPDDTRPQGYAAGARTVFAHPRSSVTPSSSAGERR